MKKSVSKLKIRLADDQDLKFTFELYNKNVLEKKFYTSKKINFQDHLKWFKNKRKEKMFFICFLNDKIGYVRFDKINEKNLSVSIAIKKSHQRKGYGKAMLVKVLNKKKISEFNIWAYVKTQNKASKKFFLDSGFEPITDNKLLRG